MVSFTIAYIIFLFQSISASTFDYEDPFDLTLRLYTNGIYTIKKIHSCDVAMVENSNEFFHGGSNYDERFESIYLRKRGDTRKKSHTAMVGNFEECVEECLSVADCNAVTYQESSKFCQLRQTRIMDGKIGEKRTVIKVKNQRYTHGYITCVHTSSEPIENGVQAKEHEPSVKPGPQQPSAYSWPWILHMAIYVDGKGLKFCSANLIPINGNNKASDILVTTASCVAHIRHSKYIKELLNFGTGIKRKPIPADNIRVSAGKSKFGQFEEGEQHTVGVEVLLYRHIVEREYDDDIALVKIFPPLQFSDKVRPIDLPVSWSVMKDENMVAGWWKGLQQTDGLIKNNVRCLDEWKDWKHKIKEYGGQSPSPFRNEMMMCVFVNTRNSQSCADHQGAMLATQNRMAPGGWPLQTIRSELLNRWTLNGISTSRCKEIATGGELRVFVNIDHYSMWIRNKANLMTSL